MSLYNIEKYKTLVQKILSIPIAMVLEDQILNWPRKKLSENVYFTPLAFKKLPREIALLHCATKKDDSIARYLINIIDKNDCGF